MIIGYLELACAVCFGNPDSLSSKALIVAVFFLMGTVVLVLGGIGWTALAWSKHEKRLATRLETRDCRQ